MTESGQNNRGIITDLELMTAIQDGEQSALETLVKRHEDRIFALAFRILGNREDARDVVQDVFIKLWENPSSWKPSALFTTWLYRVTTNHALNKRRLSKFKQFISLSSSKEDSDSEFPLDDLEDKSIEQPDEQLISRERQFRVEHAMSRINPRQRAALHLRYGEGLPVSEVAQALGVTLKSAESLIFRGKQSLKMILSV